MSLQVGGCCVIRVRPACNRPAMAVLTEALCVRWRLRVRLAALSPVVNDKPRLRETPPPMTVRS
jgi:hypothetical protein